MARHDQEGRHAVSDVRTKIERQGQKGK
ncbi:uncharacterized protein G2W53_020583 [Senna tora]|uniref:Uncharacterized protein n=1 Tax=Senna tora TaxID=362788 RepID=A0A834TWV1_9FABA|nr:uncharacterized protein G2W53_020583 [Senna tora]